jgi:hypothetical protein
MLKRPQVGHGTCGVGGKGMTDYTQRGKWQFESGKPCEDEE